ncbi:anti-sigma factor antagonist [Actinomadura craniellae]|uniref:Anti-sigma factor antagonist n=1 Tax=Actinomadura craniellae TaxID=2231787 RepID=A0A365HG92_9ACTN|nr:STAS domain-containing protein [Actinomadura craniellae]RAY17093.1 anti-sigma factor antagonist [Actinomadura craniellae]
MLGVAAYEPADQFDVTIGLRGRWIVVELLGELDLTTAPRLESEVTAALDMPGDPRLALDLAGVTFCDSSGLAAFIRLWRNVQQRAGEFVLLRPQEYLLRWLEITGLRSRIDVRDDLADEDTGLADLASA